MKTSNKLQLITVLTNTLLTVGLCNFAIAEPSLSESGNNMAKVDDSSTTQNQRLKFKIAGKINP